MIIYLASPYSSPDPAVRQARYNEACRATAFFMEQGHVIYSPIAHSHPVADYLPQSTLMDHEFWMGQCLPMVRACSELWVLMLEGWEKSRGCRREVQEALDHEIPISHILMPTKEQIKCVYYGPLLMVEGCAA